ncbi:Leucine-rich_repeat domain superfamily [Hexamita inflata]|uniref:Leucine-rich repeat domain superfamily n=1 Tax=Hexamita inflata TaxID=28002 RepID=A0AA86P0L2_9EUKA|nr:Leucine-rich repeat domain superfamily [Hexamita inflata]
MLSLDPTTSELNLAYQDLEDIELTMNAPYVKSLLISGNPLSNFAFLGRFCSIHHLQADNINLSFLKDFYLIETPLLRSLQLRFNNLQNFTHFPQLDFLTYLDVSLNDFQMNAEDSLEVPLQRLEVLEFGSVPNVEYLTETLNGLKPVNAFDQKLVNIDSYLDGIQMNTTKVNKTQVENLNYQKEVQKDETLKRLTNNLHESMNSFRLFVKFFLERFYVQSAQKYGVSNSSQQCDLIIDILQYESIIEGNSLLLTCYKTADQPIVNQQLILTGYQILEGFQISQSFQKLVYIDEVANSLQFPLSQFQNNVQIQDNIQENGINQQIYDIYCQRRSQSEVFNILTVEINEQIGVFTFKNNQFVNFHGELKNIQHKIMGTKGVKLEIIKKKNQIKQIVINQQQTTISSITQQEQQFKRENILFTVLGSMKVNHMIQIKTEEQYSFIHFYRTSKTKQQLSKQINKLILQLYKKETERGAEVLIQAIKQFNSSFNKQVKISDNNELFELVLNLTYRSESFPFKIQIQKFGVQTEEGIKLSKEEWKRFVLIDMFQLKRRKFAIIENNVKWIPNVSNIELKVEPGRITVENETKFNKKLQKYVQYEYYCNNNVVKTSYKNYFKYKTGGMYKIIAQIFDDDKLLVKEIQSDTVYVKQNKNIEFEQENSESIIEESSSAEETQLDIEIIQKDNQPFNYAVNKDTSSSDLIVQVKSNISSSDNLSFALVGYQKLKTMQKGTFVVLNNKLEFQYEEDNAIYYIKVQILEQYAGLVLYLQAKSDYCCRVLPISNQIPLQSIESLSCSVIQQNLPVKVNLSFKNQQLCLQKDTEQEIFNFEDIYLIQVSDYHFKSLHLDFTSAYQIYEQAFVRQWPVTRELQNSFILVSTSKQLIFQAELNQFNQLFRSQITQQLSIPCKLSPTKYISPPLTPNIITSPIDLEDMTTEEQYTFKISNAVKNTFVSPLIIILGPQNKIHEIIQSNDQFTINDHLAGCKCVILSESCEKVLTSSFVLLKDAEQEETLLQVADNQKFKFETEHNFIIQGDEGQIQITGQNGLQIVVPDEKLKINGFRGTLFVQNEDEPVCVRFKSQDVTDGYILVGQRAKYNFYE